jgi:putative ABC transport system permease protein
VSTPIGQSFTSDLRSVIHSLRRSPAFTLVAIVTLALGIGANTSAFSILNALMLRPLPYADSGRLDRMYRTTAQNSRGGMSPADYLDLRRDSSGYGDVAAFGAADMNLSEPGRPAEVVVGLRVSANLFSVLGITPERGRDFRSDEEILGNNGVLLVSHRYWQNRLAGDSGAVGRIVRINESSASMANPTKSLVCCRRARLTRGIWARSTRSGRSV